MDLIVEFDGREEKVTVERRNATEVEVTVGESTYVVDASTAQQPWSLLIDGRQHEVAVSRDLRGQTVVTTRSDSHVLEVFDPLEHAVRSSSGWLGVRRGPESGCSDACRVVKVLCALGDAVEAGQGIMVLEAMKMENEILAEVSGVISELAVEEGQAVDAGDLLFVVADEALKSEASVSILPSRSPGSIYLARSILARSLWP